MECTRAKLGINPYHECNNQGRSTTILEEPIRQANSNVVKTVCDAMLACNADLERRIAHGGRTALHVAAEMSNWKATATLLNNGALVNTTDDHGQTASHIAAPGYGRDFERTMEILLEAGASLEIKDQDGNIALDHATNDVAHQLIVATHFRRMNMHSSVEPLRRSLWTPNSAGLAETIRT